MLTSLRISSSVSSFSLACFRCYIAYRVSFIFRLNAFLASVWIRLLALLTAGKGKRTGVYAEIFVSWILQLFALNFLIVNFLENCIFPTTFNHSHDPHSYPRPTTYDSGSHPDQVNRSRASPNQTQSSHSRSTQSNKCRASPDQTQSSQSRSTQSSESSQTQSSQSGSNPV